MSKGKLTRRQTQAAQDAQHRRLQRTHERALRTEQDIAAGGLGPEQPGLVITNYGATVEVEDERGARHRCAFRQNLDILVSGDRVAWQPAQDQRGVVVALAPRTSVLSRPDFTGQMKAIAANIDQILVVTAAYPQLNEGLIDRYLIAAEAIGVKPVILVNKIDLLDEAALAELRQRLADYESIGYCVLYASTKREHGLDALQAQLAGKISVLVGQSGVGKSSLVKHILPDMDVRIGEVSDATGKGRHTTSAARLYHLPAGGKLIDSPGVREFGLWNITRDQAARGFIEFHEYLGQCKFSDCSHSHEPGCALRAAVDAGKISARRFESYHRIVDSLPNSGG